MFDTALAANLETCVSSHTYPEGDSRIRRRIATLADRKRGGGRELQAASPSS